MPDDIPYCGVPPLPGAATWNLDPALLLALAAFGLLGAWRVRGTAAWRRAALLAGWAVLALALVSPICSLSVALFSARVGQHLLLVLLAAPLLALGLRLGARGLAFPALAFGLAIWGWHLPVPYAATFAGDGIAYWAMHLTTIGSAVWFWAAILRRLADRPDAVALAGLVTAIHMGVLGALLTLAPRPLYTPHVAGGVTLPWGFTALEDQQLGGLLMWVPGGLVFAAALVVGLALALRREAAPLLAALLVVGLAGPALAQGNDATTTGAAAGRGSSTNAVEVGVLTTTEVTTGQSGPRGMDEGGSGPAPEDRRLRVLGPVCNDLRGQPEVLAQCRAKAGLATE